MRSKGLVLKWVAVDPRKVVDDYKPDIRERAQSISEERLFDDDGKLQNAAKETGASEDEIQLQAILSSSNLPLPEDGGIDEEALKLAAAVPLPLDNETPTTWKSRITKPFSGVSMPSVSRPSVSLPSVPSKPTFSIPTFKMPLKGDKEKPKPSAAKEDDENQLQKTSTLEDATQVPLPIEILDEPPVDGRSPSVDSGVVIDIYEVAKDE